MAASRARRRALIDWSLRLDVITVRKIRGWPAASAPPPEAHCRAPGVAVIESPQHL